MLHVVLGPRQNHGLTHGNAHLLVNPKYKELWGKSYMKELGCLAQDIPGISKGTNAIIFIQRKDIQNDCKCDIAYAWVCVNNCMEKEDPNRTQATVGSNFVHYPGSCGTPTVNMVTVKLHLNSIISTKKACYCTIDLKDFCLNAPMDQLEFMRMKLSDLPHNFIKIYDCTNLVNNNCTIIV
jgi:hypothetical protein